MNQIRLSLIKLALLTVLSMYSKFGVAGLNDHFVYSVALNSYLNSVITDDSFSKLSEDGRGFEAYVKGNLSGSPRGSTFTALLFEDDVLNTIITKINPPPGHFNSYLDQREWTLSLVNLLAESAKKKYGIEYKENWNVCDGQSTCSSQINFQGQKKTLSLQYNEDLVYYFSNYFEQKENVNKQCSRDLKSFVVSSISISYTSEIKKSYDKSGMINRYSNHLALSPASYITKKYDRKDIRRQFIERYVPIKAMEDNSWCIYMRAPDVLPASFEGQSIWHTPPKLFVKSLRLQ